MVPEGWTSVPLSTLFEFKNGLGADAKSYGSGIKFVNVMDVFSGASLTEDCIIGSVQVSPRQVDSYSLQYGDVLFNRTSETPEEIAYATVYLDNKPAVFGSFVIRARPVDDRLEPNFCKYAFQPAYVREQMISRCQGAIRANIGQADLRKVKMLLPPKSEQGKISKILSTWDRAIEVTKSLIGNSRLKKKELMRQLLNGAVRLPGFRRAAWKSGRFDELFKVANNKSAQVSKSEYRSWGAVPIVDQGKALIAGYTDKLETYSTVPVIVFGDHTRIFKWVDFEFCPGADGTQILVTQSSVDLKLGFFLLQNTKLPNLGYSRHMRELKEAKFLLPSDVKEQKAIALVLEGVDKEIENLTQQLDALTRERSALMQQLLEGKRQVRPSEVANG